jgi:hypothetical protein
MRDQIAAKCLEMAAKCIAVKYTPPFDIDEAWQTHRGVTHFNFALTGSQQISFVATYNAYDDLLMRCLRIALSKPHYRKRRDADFAIDFQSAFDNATYAGVLGQSRSAVIYIHLAMPAVV